MEASSPLATAMRGPMPSWGDRLDPYAARRCLPSMNQSSMGNAAISLREQLHKHSADYFNVKDLRGSSPAASLAADLSQNFRIDNEASPQFPTPRRALFTANTMGGIEGRGFCTTPPLASSSPAPLMETMEISPLPHKVPFFTQFDVTSPTPITTPCHDDEDEDMMLDSPAPISRQPSLEPSRPVIVDRKLAAPRRPSLSRMKNLTTSAIIGRSHAETQLPPFRFGAISSFGESSSAGLSPSDCFLSASPPQERRPQSAESPYVPIAPPLRRPQLGCLPPSARYASPANCHARRQSNPFLRNRKQFRRSLSMFEHPADVMKPKPETEDSTPSGLQSVLDVEETNELALPHVMPDDPSDTIPRISKETLLKVLDGTYADNFDQKMIIDCRFEYEYDGGHIDSAVNYNDKDLLSNQLFQTPMSGRTLLVFHCEYSAHRAPLMARHVRSEDRTINAEHYPRLTYPEVYILEGGYSAFFADHRGRCFPPEYVEMSDQKHQRTCEREMGRLKSRKGFCRAQTFAFGQREPSCDDSPTAPSRPSSRQAQATYSSFSPDVFGDRSHTRRMVSY